MEFRDLSSLFVRHVFAIALSTVFGLFGAIAVNFYSTPLYTSSAVLFISTPIPQIDLNALAQGGNFGLQRVKSYSDIVDSPAVLLPVIEELKLPISYSELADKVKSRAPLDTVLVTITVTDINPDRSAAIVNSVAKNFTILVNDIEQYNEMLPLTTTQIKVSVVTPGTANELPSAPRKNVNILLGLIFGLILGTAISILREIADKTVKNESHLLGKTLLGTISTDPSAQQNPLVINLNPYHVRAEAFRQFRNNLVNTINESSGIVSLSMTSCVPFEGKTTSLINLAITFSQSGVRVLIIEADLRRPQVYNYLNSEALVGLALELDYQGLAGYLNTEISPSIHHSKYIIKDIDARVPNLSIMFAGKRPENLTNLFAGEKFKELLSTLKKSKKYDLILIDTPPVLPVADASSISAVSDGTIFVVKAGSTKRKQLQAGLDTIENLNGGKVLGISLNMIPFYRRGDNYGYYYGRYYRMEGKRRSSDYGYSNSYVYQRYGAYPSKQDTYEPTGKFDELTNPGKLSNLNIKDRAEVADEERNSAESESSKLGKSTALLAGARKILLAAVKSGKRKSSSSLIRVNMNAESQKQQDLIDEFFKSVKENEGRTVKNSAVQKSSKNYANSNKTAPKKKASMKKKSSAKPIAKKPAKRK